MRFAGSPTCEPARHASVRVMSVRLTRIYTKTGDKGSTKLGDMSDVRKTDVRLAAFADVDEANAVIGTALALGELRPDLREVLLAVQNDLFDVGADLCTPVIQDPPYPPIRLSEDYVTRLEGHCDAFNDRLGKLDSFILPGGSPGAALLHHARTVVRRAERQTWALIEADAERTNEICARYLNRLSDLLFILARTANPDGDVLWKPRGNATGDDGPVSRA